MEGQPVEQQSTRDIIPQAGSHVLNLYNQFQNLTLGARLVFHNYQFVSELVRTVEDICIEERLSDQQTEIASLAAWFYFTGYLVQPNRWNDKSIEQANHFLKEFNYPEEGRKLVLDTMRQVASSSKLTKVPEKVLSDAIRINTRIVNFSLKSPLEQLEQEFLSGQQYTKLEWATLQMQQLLEVRLYTSYVRSNFEGLLASNILDQKNAVEKIKRKLPEEAAEKNTPLPAYKGLEKDTPIRATQTFFRANFRNHINLSSIADNKANIMISVNSILISVLITLLSYQNIAETNPMILLPVVIFLVTGLASLIFAVLSARPKVTNLNAGQKDKEEIKKNIVFFGNFVNLDLDQYEEAMDAMFRDDELIYGNMVRDLYHLGKVLDKKYRYLSISYNIFMVGFIATVGTFLIALFT